MSSTNIFKEKEKKLLTMKNKCLINKKINPLRL